MAGVEADLTLDSRQALAAVAALESAIDAASSITITVDTSQVPPAVSAAIAAADSQVVVTGDADQLTGEVTGAVDSADTEVLVTGDAEQVTGEVTGAVDAADSNVIVTGDASQVTGAVTSAVDAADTNVVVTADSSSLAAATDASDALNTSLIASSRSGLQLRSVLAVGGVGAAVAGLGALVNAASDLEQAVGGTRAVFGEAQGAVVSFARGAAEAAGLSEEAARRLTSQIGGLLQGFQFTQEEAAATSVQLAQLGADLAATFGGNPEEAVQALGAALRGEFDPLERFGVSLNITQANLKAVELGLADSTSNVSLNARAQASLALIMERSSQAQGQFGREVNTAAGQLERAKAEAQNAAAAVGAALLPAFVDLVGIARDTLLPTLQRLGETLGPALGRVLQSAGPLIEGFGAGLAALAPLATALAAVIDAIPEPVLTMIGTFLAFRAAAGPFGQVLTLVGTALVNMIAPASAVSGITAELGKGTTVAGGGFSSLLAAINPVTAALAVAAIGFTVYSQRQAENKREAAELAAQSDALGESLLATEGVLDGVEQKLVDMARAGDDVVVSFERLGNVDVPLSGSLARLGLSAQEAADLIAEGDQAVQDFLNTVSDGSNETALAASSVLTLSAAYQEEAQAAIQAGLATEAYTQRQIDSAIEQTRTADGARNYVAALALLRDQELAATEAQEQQTAALNEAQQALANIAAEAPAVGLLMTALTTTGGQSAANLASFALAATDAGLSTEQLSAVLGQFGGSDAPGFAAAIAAVNETITGLRDAATGTLPSLQDMAGAVEDFTLEGFRDQLAEGLTAITNFNSNLAVIAEQGGPRLAAAAAQLGPEFAQGIADGLASGSPEVAAQAELLLAGIEQAGADTSTLITGTLGPNLATATGQMGALATAAFGQSYVLDASGQIVQVEGQVVGGTPGVAFRNQEMGSAGASGFDTTYTPNAQPAIDTTVRQISEGVPAIEGASKNAGTVGKTGYEGAFQPNPGPAVEAARGIIAAGAQVTQQAGFQLGDFAVRGFADGTRRIGSAASAAASDAVSGLSGARGAAYSEGFTIGGLLAQGIAQGIRGSASVAAAAATAAVNQAASAARAAGRIASPSKVFREIGLELGAGMAVGLDASAAAVGQAAGSLTVAAAAAAAGSLDLGVATPAGSALAATGAAVGAGTGSSFTVVVGPRAVVIEGSNAPTDDIARAAAGLAGQLARQIKLVARTGG